MYAAKSANTHHCKAYAALRHDSPPPANAGGGTRCTAGERGRRQVRLLGGGKDKGVVHGPGPAVDQQGQVQGGHLPVGQGCDRRSSAVSGRLPRRQGPGHGDLGGDVWRGGLRGIGDESPHDGDPGAGGPHDQGRHDPVSALAPKQPGRHEHLRGPVIPARRGDPAAFAVDGKRGVWGEDRGDIGDRQRRRGTGPAPPGPCRGRR